MAGPVYCDLVFGRMDELPELGTEVFAPELLLTAGGSAITAVALRRLGVSVALAADIGDDLAGETVRAALADENVSGEHLLVHRGSSTPITAVLSTHRDRAFVTHLPLYPNGYDLPAILAATRPRHLHVAGFPVALTQTELLTTATQLRTTTSFDPGWDPSALASPDVKELALTCDVFLPSLNEAREIVAKPSLSTLEAAKVLCEQRAGRLTIVKDGPRGAVATQGDTVLTADPLEVEVVDTTGAGDVFDAVFLAAWLSDRPLEECLRRAAVGGSLAVTASGGFTAAPYEEDLASVEP